MAACINGNVADPQLREALRMMWWTTPAPDIECVKG
jgi:hypothetical protein